MSDKFMDAQALDETMMRNSLRKNPSREWQQNHAPGVPTYFGTIKLAKQHGIVRLPDPHIEEIYRDGKVMYHVIQRVQKGNRIMAGAASNVDGYYAIESAWRNAVRNVLYGEE